MQLGGRYEVFRSLADVERVREEKKNRLIGSVESENRARLPVELLTVEIGDIRKIICSFNHNY